MESQYKEPNTMDSLKKSDPQYRNKLESIRQNPILKDKLSEVPLNNI